MDDQSAFHCVLRPFFVFSFHRETKQKKVVEWLHSTTKKKGWEVIHLLPSSNRNTHNTCGWWRYKIGEEEERKEKAKTLQLQNFKKRKKKLTRETVASIASFEFSLHIKMALCLAVGRICKRERQMRSSWAGFSPTVSSLVGQAIK